MIVGIDEVGRGPWAGPLLVGAVVLGDARIEGLTDSKKLSKKRREVLSQQIFKQAAGIGLGWVSNDEIDDIGLSEALKLATRRALEQITVPYHEIIIDGTVNFLAGTNKGRFVTTLKKADLLIAAVSAASIVAKVTRDDYMSEQDEKYAGYSFSAHAGYGTAAHQAALEEYGITPLHRKSFAPIALMLAGQTEPTQAIAISNKSVGNQGESVADAYLISRGYDVVERNWKTRYCEIDIVAEKDNRLYFVEVKHRKKAKQGGGIVAITPLKLRRMKFAASVYLKYQNAFDRDAILVVVTTTGTPPTFESFLELT